MSVSFGQTLVVVYFGVYILPMSTGYFGLAAKGPLRTSHLGEHQSLLSNNIASYASPSVCDMLKLHGKQKRMCKKGHGVAETLIEASKMALDACQSQFLSERWNCTLGIYRENILKKSFQETSFLYAITSAGLVHAFARACSLQRLDRCTCAEFENKAHRSAWSWGGCGDNIRYGLKFTRRFLGRARKSGKDFRAEVDQHNTNVGLRVVKENVRTTCKCHGISGTCTTKTCWRQLLPFDSLSAILKNRYEAAVKVVPSKNQANGKSRLLKVRKTDINSASVPPKRKELVFLEKSPSFCRKSRFSPGTVGRACEKGSNCDVVCCGRGYNVRNIIIRKSCQCRVIWCCHVKCQQCNVTEDVYSCK